MCASAKFWLRVLAEIKNRGVKDVCLLVCDGLKGLPDAAGAIWEKTIVQTCIVHLLRNSFKYASKRDWAQIAKDLKPVDTAASEAEALDRFAEFSGSGRSGIQLLYGCGRMRGPNSCRSLPSAGK
jgi:putative transposase